MSQPLSVELSDDAFDALRRRAEAVGTSTSQLASMTLERQFGSARGLRGEEGQQAARERFERHFGEVDLGRPTGTENDEIDEDLAREYADTHEDP